MIVVADAGPPRCFVLIGASGVLKPLYTRGLVPRTVARELREAATPVGVPTWIAQPSEWCETRQDLAPDPALHFLDPGERAAIALALYHHAERLLIDEWEGRAEAEGRHLRVTGTLGILAEAHRGRLLGFPKPTSTLRRNCLIPYAAICPPDPWNGDRAARASADLAQPNDGPHRRRQIGWHGTAVRIHCAGAAI